MVNIYRKEPEISSFYLILNNKYVSQPSITLDALYKKTVFLKGVPGPQML